MQRFLLITGIGLMAAFADGPAATAEKKVDPPKVVKFAELIGAIKEHQDKVVVVDFWADTWLICKEEFPHLVQMHEKYEKDGLVAMSVNLDDPKDEKVMKAVHDFLVGQKAAFSHFVLDEPVEDWEKRLNIVGPPVVFVFGKDGKLAKKYENVDYKAIEEFATGLLKE